jgi:hypothetical protein
MRAIQPHTLPLFSAPTLRLPDAIALISLVADSESTSFRPSPADLPSPFWFNHGTAQTITPSPRSEIER